MALIKLNDWGTRAVLNRFNLTASRRIGKGQFCAVYEDGPDAVIKLTTDSIQVESVRDYLGGVHFPKMLGNEGHVGVQYKGDVDLYLFKAERLRPLREADAATRKLACTVLDAVEQCWNSRDVISKATVRGTRARRVSLRSQAVLEQLKDNKDLPESLREAFEDILRMVWNYDDLCLDFHRANLMVRGTDELIFNDVILDGNLAFDRQQ
jgi:hypothetical protein